MYEIPQQLEYKEKIVFGLNFKQLAYALLFFPIIFVLLFKIIKEILDKHHLMYPASEKDALECYLQEKAPEMIGRKDNDLMNNSNFIGFFIPGLIDSKTKKMLKEKYPNKILFDGENLKKISQI